LTSKYDINGSLLIKNTAFNFLGLSLPLLVGLFTVPVIIQGLGPERFGILSLALAVLGYSGILNLGLNRAATKYISQALGRNLEYDISSIVWTSLIFQLMLGFMGTLLLLGITPVLIEQILNIPPELIAESKKAFYALSFIVPLILFSLSLKGVLEAGQQFGKINLVVIPGQCLNLILPVIGILLNFSLFEIILLYFIPRLGEGIAYFFLCLRVFPLIKKPPDIDLKIFRTLLGFGGWVTVCNILIPMLLYMDRFFLGILSSVAAVGYYCLAQDIALRLRILPTSFVKTIFPAFSSLNSDPKRQQNLFIRSMKYLLLIMGPIVFSLMLLADDLLLFWLGPEWAANSAFILKILAAAMLINALSQIPMNFLDGIGRPDLRAKIFLCILPVFMVFLWFFIKAYGLKGAAAAWLIRTLIEFLIFLGAVWRLKAVKLQSFLQKKLVHSAAILSSIFIFGLILTAQPDRSFFFKLIITLCGISLFLFLEWKICLDKEEKDRIVFYKNGILSLFRHTKSR